jgi:V8-like Glu-specific endopeptidase
MTKFRSLRVIVTTLLFATPALAQNVMKPLPQDTRAEFPAVGRVNYAGYNRSSLCSGTLIAPDVVLTAGHCIGAGGPSDRVFVAGWDRGDHKGASKSGNEIRHPGFRGVGSNDPIDDLGLIFLEEPIEGVEPLTLGEPDGWEVGIVGYHWKTPHLLSGRLDCASGPRNGVMQITCPVAPGNSGGPVVQMHNGEWVVVAVISARRLGGTALAVPISDWVQQQLRLR